MEARFNRDDARVGGIRSLDAAGAYADQLAVAWVFVCGDVWCRIDFWNVSDVGPDRPAVRVQLQQTDSSSSAPANTRRRLQHLLRRLVRIQSRHPVTLS